MYNYYQLQLIYNRFIGIINRNYTYNYNNNLIHLYYIHCDISRY